MGHRKPKKILHAIIELSKLYQIHLPISLNQNNIKNNTLDKLFAVLKSLDPNIFSYEDILSILNDQKNQLASQVIEPVIVIWQNKKQIIPFKLLPIESLLNVKCSIIQETGISYHWEVDLASIKGKQIKLLTDTEIIEKIIILPIHLPIGYHHLILEIGNKKCSSLILVADWKVYEDNKINKKIYGFFAPIYALHSRRSLGSGDLTDFKKLISWCKKNHAHMVGTLPIYAQFLKTPFEISPYSPVSRLFWNDFFLDISTLANINSPLNNKLKKLFIQSSTNEETIVNYDKIIENRREIIYPIIKKFFHEKTFCSFLELSPSTPLALRTSFNQFIANNPEVISYASFQAGCEIYNKPWTQWTDFENSSLETSIITKSLNFKYHLFAQWQLSLQLKNVYSHAKKSQVLLYFDLPLGVHRQGYDTWKYQEIFAFDANIGAPPDAVFVKGQNWQIPPINPNKIRASGYLYLRKCFQTIMSTVDILRLDHVMGFHRLFWIPKDLTPEDGFYVNYPANEFYALLSIESHRHKVVMVGENLGNVPASVNKSLKSHHLHFMNIVQYELDSDHTLTLNLSKSSLGSLNTHDMPPFAAYCQALDIKEKFYYRLFTERYANQELKKRHKRLKGFQKILIETGLLKTSDKDSLDALLKAGLKFLGISNSEFLLINIEDLWQETASQNIPTINNEYNWRRKLKFSLEDLNQPFIINLINAIHSARTQEP